MKFRWRCTVCNYIYDEEKEGIKFKQLPYSWTCPVCGAPKSAFEPIGKEEIVTTTVADKILEQLAALGVEYVYGGQSKIRANQT